MPAALSSVDSGASFAEDWKTVQAYSQETHKRSSKLARKSDLDSSPNLATVLGASIEVLGAVYQGLAVVGSTKLFGFANPRRNKVPKSEELAYILGSWLQKNPLPEWMSKPLNQSYFNDFGF